MEMTPQREELIQYISVADEAKIAALYTLLQDDMLPAHSVPQEQLDMIFAARDADLQGLTPSRRWEEVLEDLKKKLKKNAA